MDYFVWNHLYSILLVAWLFCVKTNITPCTIHSSVECDSKMSLKNIFNKLFKKKIMMLALLSGVILWFAYNTPWISANVLGDYLTILVLVMLLAPMIYAGRK